ncbi:M1 family aminopeptidase [Rheinheimera sp.]|uniref:ABC transporter permease/M1 family aminopeptidase n=1 Tax=Rheinheimera sp. TaxID=1869214 RepID=UPI0027B92F60|nr:M1 family aminopeptidase [Rheinheimera sp.]
MLWQIIRFEWRYYLRQPSFYVTSLLFFLMTFFAASSESVQIGGGGEVWGNGPFAVAQTMLVMSLFAMFLVVNFVGNSATRNHSCQMEELVYSKPLTPWQYQLGRFIGAYVVVLLVFAFVPLGTLIGSLMPWVDQERFGPTVLSYYLSAFLMFSVPTLFVLSALFFAIANKFRSMMALYLVVVAVFMLYLISGNFTREPQYRTLAALLDPFGLRTFADVARYWTISEKNNLIMSFSGVLLYNRLIWVSVGVVVLLCFGGLFGELKLSAKAKEKKSKHSASATEYPLSVLQTKAQQPSLWQQFWLRTRFEMRQVFFSPPFIILGLLCIFNLVVPMVESEGLYGTPDWPLTQAMVAMIVDATGLLFIIIATYYCAEVVWRERSAGIGDITDSLPVPNMVYFSSKLVAVWLLMASLFLSFAVTTVCYQLLSGMTELDPVQYLVRLGYFNLLPFMMLVVLAFMIQTLSPNKYVGMLVFVVYFISTLVMDAWGFSHKMFQYGQSPNAPFSDLNRFGWTLESHSWYMLYWGALVLVFFVLGYGFYQRGPAQSLKNRAALFRYQVGTQGLVVITLALMLFAGSGSWIYYNTRVLNQFLTAEQRMDIQADYEKAFKQYADDPILVATTVKADVDIYPAERQIKARIKQQMRNKFDRPLTKMLVHLPENTREFSIKVPGATLGEVDRKFNIAWLTFATPLAPGATVDVDIELLRSNPGFKDNDIDVVLVENGTFINNNELLPGFGYQNGYELQERHERAKRDLAPVQRAHKLEDQSRYTESGFGRGEDFIQFETTVSTSADQIAIAPGYLQKEWQEGNRRYFHYQMDKPMFNFYSFLSARLDVKKQSYKGVALEVYYHGAHHWNVERMMESMRDSLDYFNQAFGPYQHQQMRIIEFPGYRRFAQSFANTVPYSEQIGFIADLRNKEELDMPYYVTAHEMAHQWWGHQVGTANVQGSAVIPETLAQYSALRVMENKYGPVKLRKFLKYELDRYLRERGSERVEEMPLLRAEGQGYIHYRKGSLVMMALKNRLGAAQLDKKLQAFLQEFQYKQNPYPTTLDLLRHLKAGLPAVEQAFIDDLFVNITLYDLRLKDIKQQQLPDGQLKLTLTIDAAKLTADGKGKESTVVLSEAIDIGVYTEDPDDFSKEPTQLYFQAHQLQSGTNQIELTVPAGTAAVYVAVDPLMKLIDRDAADNIRKM